MHRKIPSTQALACFEAAARHESYTRAAQELALTQSAVSRQINALESFLGVALFRRTRHGVVLTPSGAGYWRQVARRLQGLERDTLDVMARQGQGGALALAAVPTFATRWLIPRLPQLAARHPDITVHIETRTRPFLFTDAEFDAALYAGTPEQVANWPGTRAVQLLQEDVLPVCSPALLPQGRAVEPAALAPMPLLQQSTRPYVWRQWFDAMGVAPAQAPKAMDGPRYELFSMLAQAAACGMGVALIPPLLIEAEVARGELVAACERPLRGERNYYLVTPAQEETPVLAAFGAWLAQAARAAQ
ncbi:LysR substrate-binding domain-containing protein [Ramlibacter sp. H39-3-26]|uniref:LysR substrate-binding domain-containing protein n=1 Tax=Curvibacter soli TaxID=3031331 RepID=UPI0023D99CB4|nr:LysR substrate-binding domain-containing protein [Ramlibacter sp. H39-3-26]MDF1485030.1 LysR substrate-binding domain-containing protein [Ramlibacter sp. H39-3-26]